MGTAPTLDTPRLLLRPHQRSDFDDYAKMFASERALHMGQLGRRQAWYSYAAEVGHWALLGFGPWALELKENKALVGQVAILWHAHFPEPELGWFLFEGHEGKGLAFEAATAARDWAFENEMMGSLVSYIDPANHRSIALAERLGATLDPKANATDQGDLVYRHPIPSPPARSPHTSTSW
ncbi:GNAT family N-acetyltransferase [Kiloniella sp.]|uniref:GNAT family N-acetyltransferase n=1 Tax=Kiloniella sp. TaxID=1938587 RepID=UPI003B0258FD